MDNFNADGWRAFYGSRAWKNTRKAYAKSVGNLCERCLRQGIIKPGYMVHHKKHLDADLVNDPNVALSWDNLELLCRDCHAFEHRGAKRYTVSDDGKIIF